MVQITVVRPLAAKALSFVQSDRAVTESRPEVLSWGVGGRKQGGREGESREAGQFCDALRVRVHC